MASTTAAGIQGAFQGIGGAVEGYFAWQGYGSMARGYGASADLFGRAAKLADENADITREATEIQLLQSERQIYKTISGQKADVAGAGFTASGTALDLLRDSTAQGELTMNLVARQGEINANAYELQAISFRAQQEMALAQEDAAESAGTGALIGGGIKALAGFAGLF